MSCCDHTKRRVSQQTGSRHLGALLFSGATWRLVASKLTQDIVLVGLLGSSVVSSIMIVIGVLLLPRSLLQAYAWFKRTILVSIFLTQVFLFYTQQLLALGALLLNLLVLTALNILIGTQQQEASHAEIKRTNGS
jgi:hypothetical protein